MTLRKASHLTLAVAVCLIAVTPATPSLAQAPAPAPAPAPRRPRPPAPPTWPATVRLGEATATLDAPQAEALDGNLLKARGSVSLRRPEDAEAATGTVFYEADVSVDRAARVVTLTAVRVPRVQIPAVPAARLQRIAGRLEQELTRRGMKLPLDDVLASARFAPRREEAPAALGTDPPRILVESEPAILVLFDGEPRFKAVEKSFLERALNTPFLVLHDPVAKAYYLDGGTVWFRAPEVAGPWAKADVAPPEALRIARADRKDAGVPEGDVEKAKAAPEDKRLPKILVATQPSELVVSDGPPRWKSVVSSDLETMSNTESDVFRTPADGRVFVVLSGRWFSAPALSGPWAYVAPEQLPPAFSRIPADSVKASVLAFVPGTATARDALRDATTPRTAAVKRRDAHVEVAWDGEPKFEAIPGTQVEYALNTPEQVLRIRGRYFACDQGVWFASDEPTGPWKVTDSVPEQDIQAIPPESPAYNTRFVSVYDATPDTVYVAYTPAYLGSYPWHGAVVFGTGWFYRPWWGGYYYPRPWTWGFHARWAPYAGWGWGFGWGPAWAGFRYGFGFGWGARWCGPGGFYRPFYRNVNVTRTVNVTRNVYSTGANTTRASAVGSAARATPSQKTASAGKTGAQGSAAKGAAAKGAGAKAQGGKAPAAHARSTGVKGGHGGGGHKQK